MTDNRANLRSGTGHDSSHDKTLQAVYRIMKEASMSRFDRNYTEEGYLMNYETPEMIASLKRQVLQFRIELEDIEPAIWRRIQVPTDC